MSMQGPGWGLESPVSAGIYGVDPIAGHMGVCLSVRQQKGMSWLISEMFQESAFAYSTGRSQGSRGDFQYLAERTDGVSSYLGCLIRTPVRHDDNPQRVPPTGIAVSGEDTADTLGYRGGVIARWYDNTNRFDSRSEPTSFAVRAGVRAAGRRRISYLCGMHTRGIAWRRLGSRQ
jgi:hypothetical protein